MGKQIIQIIICFTFLSACATSTPTSSPVDATVAALSTKVAQQDAIISYLATRVDASRAGTPTPIGLIPTMTPYVTPTPDALIEYGRMGGIAGFIDNLKIDAKGHATLKRRNANSEFDLTVDDLNRLQSSLRNASFAAIPENSMPKQLVPDEFSYTIVYQAHTVRTSDTAMPKSLQSIAGLFNAIIERAK
jgi:hypothetical protein